MTSITQWLRAEASVPGTSPITSDKLQEAANTIETMLAALEAVLVDCQTHNGDLSQATGHMVRAAIKTVKGEEL